MSNHLAPQQADGPRVNAERRPQMLKADLRKAEKSELQAGIGACLDYARRAVGWTLDQLAAELKRDARQVRRWIAGEERTQVDVVFGVQELRGPFVIGLARLAECEVETTIRIRKIG